MSVSVFLTGGTGFIGQHLLQDAPPDVNFFLLTRHPDKLRSYQSNRIKILEGDLTSFHKFSTELSQTNYFVHIAGEKRNVLKMRETNVEGTHKVLSAMSKYPEIKLVHISSGGVYGLQKHPQHQLDENQACYPQNEYEKTKLEAEHIIIKQGPKQNLSFSILRPTNVIGEADDGKKLLNLIRSIIRKHFFYIDANAMVNYVYVKSLTYVIFEMIRNDMFKNEIYNVNSACNINEFIGIIQNATGIKFKPLCLPGFFAYPVARIGNLLPPSLRIFDLEKYRELTNTKIYPSDKLKQVIDFNEKEWLITGLNNLVKYYRKKGWL